MRRTKAVGWAVEWPEPEPPVNDPDELGRRIAARYSSPGTDHMCAQEIAAAIRAYARWLVARATWPQPTKGGT